MIFIIFGLIMFKVLLLYFKGK